MFRNGNHIQFACGRTYMYVRVLASLTAEKKANNPSFFNPFQELARLQSRREMLMKTGSYKESNTVIKVLDNNIKRLMSEKK